MMTNILEYLDRSSSLWPNKVAIADDKNRLTFQDWQFYSQNIGSVISKECNSALRKPILVFTDRSIECLVGFMGVVESGNFYVPIDNKMPFERVKLICDVLDPIAAIVVSPKDVNTLHQISFEGKILIYNEIISSPADPEKLSEIRGQIIDLDPVYSIFTSGSTGVPKGVIVSQRGMIDLAEWLVETFVFNEYDSLGNQTPFYFDGSVKDICICLKTGATLNIITKKYFSFPKLIVPFLNERKITAILWATSAVTLIGNSRIFDLVLPEHLRLVTFAGEAMPAKQLNYWIEKLPDVKFANLYGPTEVTVDCSYYVVDRKFSDDEYIPIGKECNNKQILVLDENDRLVNIDEPGELCVRGTGVALGYYNNELKSMEVFVQNPLHSFYRDIIYRTGDIVKYNDRNELVFISRKDFQIKHKGNRIELGEIEVAVNALPNVTNATCIFDNDQDKIVLYYTSSSNSNVDIINDVKSKIPVYMFPEVINRVPQMPYSMNGKIDRIELKKLYDASKVK